MTTNHSMLMQYFCETHFPKQKRRMALFYIFANCLMSGLIELASHMCFYVQSVALSHIMSCSLWKLYSTLMRE